MKTRLATGVSGTVFHRLFNKKRRQDFTWAMNLKPGDVINSFDAWNHKVERVDIIRMDVSKIGSTCRNRGKFVYEVEIYSTDGWVHCISETGCIVPAWSVSDLVLYHGKEVFDKMLEYGIVDSTGVRLRSATDAEKENINGRCIW